MADHEQKPLLSPLFIKQKSSSLSTTVNAATGDQYDTSNVNVNYDSSTIESSSPSQPPSDIVQQRLAKDDIESITSSTTKGSSSVMSVSINLAKTAAGTGILALPYACSQGGIVLFVGGTILISLWNVWGVKRLCECLDLLRQSQDRYDHIPRAPYGTETLGKVAYYATTTSKGDEWGLTALDVMLVILLCGIVIAYETAIQSFSPYTTGSDVIDAIILAGVLTPLCLTDDLSNLSKLSHMGLTILGFAILVIAAYGIAGYDHDQYVDIQVFSWWPKDGLVGVSRWFGCVVFGFGIVPLTFNFRESMVEPQRLPNAAFTSMLSVATFYIVTGAGLLYLYPDIDADVLSQIPDHDWLATTTRLAMIIVVIATAPLLVVPCSLIVEGKIHNHDSAIHPVTRLVTRLFLCFGTVIVSVMVPQFVLVLSFVGCFSVALVSFCIPPLLHAVLLSRHQKGHSTARSFAVTGASTATSARDIFPILSSAMEVDCIALLFGIVTTIVTTLFTIRKAMDGDEER